MPAKKKVPGSPAARLPHILQAWRRHLSTAVVRANVRCLLERMVLVGEGIGQAGRRRMWARREEDRARLEREAHWLTRTTGHNLVRRGDFPIV